MRTKDNEIMNGTKHRNNQAGCNIGTTMNQLISILFFLSTTLVCVGQNNHLQPAKSFKQYTGDLKDYYDSVFPKLYEGFSQLPYARYTSMPSFSPQYAFSIETINNKHYIVSNSFSENYWYAGYDEKGNMDNKRRNRVKISTIKTEINNDLYLKVGELFQLLAEQTKKPEEEIMGLDGVTYYFATTNKNGDITIGETWSPRNNSLLDRVVKVCDSLCDLGSGKDISQTKILQEIEKIIKGMN